MKAFGIVSALLLSAVTVSAQSTRFIAPATNQHVVAGQTFQVSIAFQDTTSSVDVVALVLGLKANDPQLTDLGQTILATSIAPRFDGTGPQGQFVHLLNVTAPSNPINGVDRAYNLTLAEFFTLGAENTALAAVSQIPIFVASS
ncbi:hypothetical protein M422DRAFT_262456 [Sphaerobolus stellatus SS14]|uniref:Dolichyl-diphosphooligosaccharide--protein glycosyltransferase subunit 2 n=1 Tax=Sphaerobolus stellatus (strain SS14) TaxID=990650 RepID=A0A0C9VCP4_SPHS4|nr:hypothetical protein M422DRAFT_262456 [Sphaerobolus stellatus SS14]